MGDVLSAELHKRVERYEAAVAELRASHEDVRDILVVDVLFERWQQLGSDLGFGAAPLPDWQPREVPDQGRLSAPELGKAEQAAWDS